MLIVVDGLWSYDFIHVAWMFAFHLFCSLIFVIFPHTSTHEFLFEKSVIIWIISFYFEHVLVLKFYV